MVHGGVAAVMEPPKLRTVFHAAELARRRHVDAGLGRRRARPGVHGDGDGAGFACEDTLALADETIGFGGQ